MVPRLRRPRGLGFLGSGFRVWGASSLRHPGVTDGSGNLLMNGTGGLRFNRVIKGSISPNS